MKKGVSHIDWVVSMGLFIVYVLILFIFIKPGYRPIDEGTILLKIVEDDFREDSYWNIDKVPLFITVSEEQYDSPGCKEDGVYKNKLEIKDFPFEWNNNFFIKKDSSYIESYLKSEAITKYLDIVADDIGQGTNTYFLLHSQDPSVVYDSSFGKTIIQPPFTNPDCFDYIFGVSEKLSGLKSTGRLSISKYPDYPNTREFAITIYNKDGTTAYSYSTAGEPPVNINVYVKQWGDWILNNDGTTIPVTVNIRAW